MIMVFCVARVEIASLRSVTRLWRMFNLLLYRIILSHGNFVLC